MSTYKFIDILTNESFTCTCYSYEMHNLQNYNKEFALWSTGRIITCEVMDSFNL